ncbi:C4-dicarboxylate ABC transporter substrate-binding protein [Planobispora rosea]|uniref:C4-dicarboxylate ABC transporter substrate-binding protein n=1 Tax=Planobispora rosea TaxID=35762 RepID=A0A8J3WBI3_PLARO|nr:tripartite tricarboxylate transporter substrate-binding protein [Planobispora rosea]GGS69795.1 C4-dicarboxylate ABC transporter substrate-binding protein [Planobispora rosea]GIH83180.1 C4-dicarboxylate ABC transporter substrate-binding protein [Planobispora rosea]
MRRRTFLALSAGITGIAGITAAATGCALIGGAGVPRAGRLSIVAPAARGQRWDRTARAVAEVVTGDGLAAAAQVGNRPQEAGLAALHSLAAPRAPFAREGRLLVAGAPLVAAAEMAGDAPVAEAVTPLARLVGDWAALVVPAGSPLRSFEDFAAALRRDPSGPVAGGGTVGGCGHVLYGMIGKCLGLDVRLLNYAGYPEEADAAEALHGGRLAALVGPVRSFATGIATGGLRPLAVSAAARIDGIDAPTLMELGIRLEYSDWCGVFGPRGMGAEDYDAAVALCDRLDASPRWRALCAREGWDRVYLSGNDFRRWLGTETRRTREALYELGLLRAADTNCGVGCAARP